MNRRFARTVSAMLAIATGALSLPVPVAARVVGTEELVLAEAAGSAAPVDRDALRGLLERDDVRRQLERLGVDPRLARERVDALTDAQIERIAGRVEQLPAGGASVVGVLFAVFVILLVTDILGLTRVFPFTRPAR